MLQAIIFDFDGLIVDTESPELQVWQEIFQEYGATTLTRAYWATYIGRGASDPGVTPYDLLEEFLGQPIDREALRAQKRGRYLDLIANQGMLPGVEESITDAKRRGLKLGVASSSSREWVAGYLERLGLLSYFDCVCCGDEVQHAKPDPELYIAVCAYLDVLPSEAVALEDSPNGITAAKRAGLYCIAVPNAVTVELPLEHADLRISSLTELRIDQLPF